MKTLDEIAIFHETDRASVFTRTYGKPHNYAVHYDKLFTPLRDQPVKLLEIGSASGEGMKMWMSYFQDEDARFFGVDNVSNTCDWNTKGVLSLIQRRYFFNCADQSDETFWKCFIANHGGEFDIILDDGSHVNSDIITAFNCMWPHVNPGGFYSIEDLGCSYGSGSIFLKPGFPHHMDWLKAKLDSLVAGTVNEIDSIYFGKELCVLRKAL